MKYLLLFAVVLFPVTFWASETRAAEPYIQIEAGVLSRDVVEKDPSIQGFKFSGTATSTRLIAKVGLNFNDVLNLYVQGGGADLAIDEFNNYDGSLKGAYGGGLRLNLYQSPYRGGLKLFVEGNALRYTTDDEVGILMNCSAANGCPANDLLDRTRLADETIQWNEYTVLLGGSGRYEGFGPYGGIRLSKVDGKDRIRAAPDANFTTVFGANPDLKEKDNFGIFFGVDFFLDRTEKTALNLEVSLIDQDSFRVAIRRTF